MGLRANCAGCAQGGQRQPDRGLAPRHLGAAMQGTGAGGARPRSGGAAGWGAPAGGLPWPARSTTSLCPCGCACKRPPSQKKPTRLASIVTVGGASHPAAASHSGDRLPRPDASTTRSAARGEGCPRSRTPARGEGAAGQGAVAWLQPGAGPAIWGVRPSCPVSCRGGACASKSGLPSLTGDIARAAHAVRPAAKVEPLHHRPRHRGDVGAVAGQPHAELRLDEGPRRAEDLPVRGGG